MYTFTTALNASNKPLLNIYNMPAAALSMVATVVKETDPDLTELCRGWMGRRDRSVYGLSQLACVPVCFHHYLVLFLSVRIMSF